MTSDQAALYDIAEASLPGAGLGGYALPKDVRFIVREGHKGRLTSVEGRTYVDYVCGAGATIIGHDRRPVRVASRRPTLAFIGKGGKKQLERQGIRWRRFRSRCWKQRDALSRWHSWQ